MPRNKTKAEMQAEHAEAIMYRDDRIASQKKELNDLREQLMDLRGDLHSTERQLRDAQDTISRRDREYAALRGAFLIVEGGGAKKLAQIEKADSNHFCDDEVPF